MGSRAGIPQVRHFFYRSGYQSIMGAKTRRLLLIAAALAAGFCPGAWARGQPRVAHVFVALCDNEHQGIVPVPERLGNGDDPANNLYWGALYGVKTHFKRSADWTLVATLAGPRPAVIERAVFRHQSGDVYLVADAYRGSAIREAVADFLEAAAGGGRASISLNAGTIALPLGGDADLLAYVGHDGLMDFALDNYPASRDGKRRSVIILACAAKPFFSNAVKKAGADPLLWTTGLLAPEAYVLEAAIAGWIGRENGEQIRIRAAAAYNRYQKCGTTAALRLFATGF